ncbi:MAG TPA: ribose-phosphate diphosphokinase [Candidatus Paceibacterota bacterium]|nr:ribose-phosphate diphosphokinase [Candidatus Paceibacterota bacterium]
MLLFSFPQYEHYAAQLRKLPRWQRGQFSVDRYQNGELFVLVKTPVKGKQCAILAETAPPDENLLSLLLLAHTLKKEGAEEVIAIIPYLGYSRHDRSEAGRDRATEWLGESLKRAGVNEVVTIDAHSAIDASLFPIPLRSLTSAGVLADAISGLPPEAITLVAPDRGAVDNCEAVRDALRSDVAIIPFEKKRIAGRVAVSGLRGTLRDRVVMVDDMLDTGETLVRCAEKLHASGARAITVLVTHGLFSGTLWRQLRRQGVAHIYCTDTAPHAAAVASQRVTVLSASGILLDHFRRSV